jgi:hypothetical protein
MMRVQLKVLHALVLTCQTDCDKVYLTTSLPNPFDTKLAFPSRVGAHLQMSFDAPAGEGVPYVVTHFGVTPEVQKRLGGTAPCV